MAQLRNKPSDRWDCVMLASTAIAQGDFVFADGNEVVSAWASDAASQVFRGIANETKTASAVAGADRVDVCRHGIFRLKHNGSMASSLPAKTEVYATSATAVDDTAGTYKVGKLVEYIDATYVWVDIRGYAF